MADLAAVELYRRLVRAHAAAILAVKRPATSAPVSRPPYPLGANHAAHPGPSHPDECPECWLELEDAGGRAPWDEPAGAGYAVEAGRG